MVAVQTETAKVVLRRSHPLRTRQWLETESAVLQYLATKGFPAARQLQTRTLDPFVEHEGRFWAVFDYIEGRQVAAPTESELVAIARTQAQLHNALAAFPDAARYATFAESVRPRKNWAYIVPLADTLKFLNRMQAQGDLANLPDSPVMETVREYLQICRQRLIRIAQGLPQLPGILTHYDYGQYNILLGQDGRPTVIDFDLLIWESPAANLARAINVVARPRWMGPFEPEKMAAYVDAYQTQRRLSDDERRALPGLLRLYMLQYVIFQAILCTQEPDLASQISDEQAMWAYLLGDEALADMTGSEL